MRTCLAVRLTAAAEYLLHYPSERDIQLLKAQMEEAIDELEEKWAKVAGEIAEIPVNPYKKDILVEVFGVAWMPYHLVEVNKQLLELPGFSSYQA